MDKFFQGVFLLVVWGFGIYGTSWVYKQRRKYIRLRRTGRRTVGIVTGHRFTGGDDGTYRAEVVFLTQEGRAQQTETTTTHAPQQFPVGASVAMLYDPAHPTDCFVDTHVERGAALVLLVILWVVAISGLALLLWGIPLEKAAT